MTYTGDRHPHNAFCTDCGERREIVVPGYLVCRNCDRPRERKPCE